MNAFLDDETLALFIEESKEHLDSVESDLQELEKQGENFDEELVRKVIRAAHSIKGGSGFLGLDTIKELALKIETILDQVRSKQLIPTSNLINALISGYKRLGEMIGHSNESNNMDISDHLNKLEQAISGTPSDNK